MMRSDDKPEEELYLRVRQCLVRCLRGRFGDDAEDMVQEIMMLAFRKHPEIRDEENLLPVCFAVMGFKSLEEIRRRIRARRESSDENIVIPDPKADAERTALMEERYLHLEASIQELNAGCQKLIRMRLDEIETAEIARRLGATLNNVHQMEFRCRQKLRAVMDRRLGAR